MSVIPCGQDPALKQRIQDYAETLRTDAHTLGNHGLSEREFYFTVFRGAIERIRGQNSASMSKKREFVRLVLNHLQDLKLIREWVSSGGKDRHDYTITMASGKVSVVELKGCLDGNNTNIFHRPANAQEFVVWGLCQNAGGDPNRNAWSGIHTRLGAQIAARGARVDGLMIWDMLCGTADRPCPKQLAAPERFTVVGQYRLPPPCVYVFPATIPHVRNNPSAVAQNLSDVQFLGAMHQAFGGHDAEVNFVDFTMKPRGAERLRKTTVRRGGAVIQESKFHALRQE